MPGAPCPARCPPISPALWALKPLRCADTDCLLIVATAWRAPRRVARTHRALRAHRTLGSTRTHRYAVSLHRHAAKRPLTRARHSRAFLLPAAEACPSPPVRCPAAMFACLQRDGDSPPPLHALPSSPPPPAATAAGRFRPRRASPPLGPRPRHAPRASGPGPMSLVPRTEVLEWGSSPLAPWLNNVPDLVALRALLTEFLQLSSFDEQGRSECRRGRGSGSRVSNGQRWQQGEAAAAAGYLRNHPAPTLRRASPAVPAPAGFVTPQVICSALDITSVQCKVRLPPIAHSPAGGAGACAAVHTTGADLPGLGPPRRCWWTYWRAWWSQLTWCSAAMVRPARRGAAGQGRACVLAPACLPACEAASAPCCRSAFPRWSH